MTGSTVVAIVGLVAALILAGRAMRARGLSGRKWLMMDYLDYPDPRHDDHPQGRGALIHARTLIIFYIMWIIIPI